MKMMNKFCALMLSVALCAGMAAPAFAYGGEPVEEAEQPVLTSTTEEEEAVTVTDEESGALTPEGNLTLVDDYHTSYSDGSGQQFITLVSKSGNTFYLVIDRNDKGENTVHFMNLVDESDLLSLMEEDAADAYTAEKEAAAQAEQERKQAEEDAKKAAEEAAASGTEQTGGNKVTKYHLPPHGQPLFDGGYGGIPAGAGDRHGQGACRGGTVSHPCAAGHQWQQSHRPPCAAAYEKHGKRRPCRPPCRGVECPAADCCTAALRCG